MKIIEGGFKNKDTTPIKDQMNEAIESLCSVEERQPKAFCILTLDDEGNGIAANASLPHILYMLEAAKIDLLVDERG
jgi:hypothetical protein